MKIKLVVTILLLVFVAASLVALFMKGGGGESDVERAGERLPVAEQRPN